MQLSVVLLVLTTIGWASAQIPCGESNYAKLDDTTSKLFVFGDGRKLPTTTGDLTKYCRESREHENSVKDYAKKCVKGVAKTLLSITIYNAARVNKQYCTNRKKKQDFISGADCVNKNQATVQKCFNGMSQRIMDADSYPDDKKKLPITCCQYFVMKDCIIKTMKGSSKCSEANVKHWDLYLDRMAIESLKVICGEEYGKQGSKSCKDLLPKVKQQKHDIPWKSPTIPIIRVLSGISEN